MPDLSYRVTTPTSRSTRHGHFTTDRTPQAIADELAAETRTTRPEMTGPLVIHVWPTRTDEHYRQPIPDDADRYDYPAPAGSRHWGRSWHGTGIEDACPCPQAPCGLVDSATVDQACPEHATRAAKTGRQGHPSTACPGGAAS